MRRIPRKDGNHKTIVDSLKAFAIVEDMAHCGNGFPDIIVGFREKFFMFEIKDGSLTASRKRLTPAEKKFQLKWSEFYHVIESVDDALKIMAVK
jgi:hypothetical protein